MKHTLTVAALATLTGCPDMKPDPVANALIGEWEEVASVLGDEEEPPEVVTFRADGTFELITDQVTTGTWSADAQTLTMVNDAGAISELPYAVEDNRMTPMAFRRAFPSPSFEGAWRAEANNDGEPSVATLDLGADASMQLQLGVDLMMAGTWRDQAGELITTLEIIGDDGQPLAFDMPWHSIDDVVSLIAYERQ